MVAYHMHPLSARWSMPILTYNYSLRPVPHLLYSTKLMKEYDTSYYGALTD